jgi:predicted RNase H-like HicB family nuclease
MRARPAAFHRRTCGTALLPFPRAPAATLLAIAPAASPFSTGGKIWYQRAPGRSAPRGRSHAQIYTAVIKQSGSWWIGWIEEVPGVNCQEHTREELLETLKVTLKEALEFNRREALEAAGEAFEEAPFAV